MYKLLPISSIQDTELLKLELIRYYSLSAHSKVEVFDNCDVSDI